MKCKVKKPYTDRITDEVHFAGETVDLTSARATELAEGGFVEKPPAPKRARAKTTSSK